MGAIDFVEFLSSGAIMSLSQDKLIVGWGPKNEFLDSERDLDKPAFFFSDFFLNKFRPWIQYSNWLELTTEEFFEQIGSISPISTSDWLIPNPEQFRHLFDELNQMLQKDELKKAVPYLFAHSSQLMTTNRLKVCLKKGLISLRQKTGYLYGKWDETEGILGITPEFLFSHTQAEPFKLHTMALAGTCHPAECQENFKKNEKEQLEHFLVVQGISHSLKSFGIVQVGITQMIHLPSLTHLMTPIEVILHQPFNFESIVRTLHPTPALGAFPQNERKKWLEEYEKHIPRHLFGSPIGVITSQQLSHCLVGIRNVQWDRCGMRIGAGCGVVKKSVFEKEWQEIHLKIRAIRNLFHL